MCFAGIAAAVHNNRFVCARGPKEGKYLSAEREAQSRSVCAVIVADDLVSNR